MKLSILQKYIVAFLGLTLLVLIATLGLARWSFDRGFLEYVNTIEQQRLERAQAVIAPEYVRSGGNWDSLTGSRLQELISDSRPGRTFPDFGPGGMPPPRPGDGSPPPGSLRRPPRGEPGYPPTAVYDANNQWVAGEKLDDLERNLNRVPIVVEGATVGELRSAPRRQLVSPQETAFSAQQLRTSWIIGIVAMCLALVVSILLARGMLSPIRRMMGEVSRLSNGDFSVRIANDRSDELGELMRNLDRLAMALGESRDARQRLLADVSHELRTPVTVLAGELEAMQDGIREFDQSQLDSLMQEVKRLRYLIDDLYELSVSDIGGLRYEFADVALHEALELVVDGARMRAAESGIQIKLAITPVRVNGDGKRLDQLFQNLLTNSLDYTDSSGEIEVKLSISGERAIIEFEDTPPGVSALECEQLFEPLYRQESSRNRRTGGAGLGLAICRKVVEAHGGVITAKPSSLGGLCVRVDLPVSSSI